MSDTQKLLIQMDQVEDGRWVRDATVAEVANWLKDQDGARVVESPDGFLAQPDDGYTPYLAGPAGEPGRYLVYRLDSE